MPSIDMTDIILLGVLILFKCKFNVKIPYFNSYLHGIYLFNKREP